MAATDDLPEQRRRTMWRPVVSALAVMAGAAYAFTHGIAAIPPFVALFLIGALANVLFRLFVMLRARFDNVVTSALCAITLMTSMIVGVVLIGWLLAFLFATTDLIEHVMSPKDLFSGIASGLTLLMYAILAAMSLMQAVILWVLVRNDAFGRRET